MKYSVQGDGSNLKITVKEVGDKQADLMKELNECAEGRCSCPTPQYAKVQEIRVAPSADQVIVTLTAKPGEPSTKPILTNASNTRHGMCRSKIRLVALAPTAKR